MIIGVATMKRMAPITTPGESPWSEGGRKYHKSPATSIAKENAAREPVLEIRWKSTLCDVMEMV